MSFIYASQSVFITKPLMLGIYFSTALRAAKPVILRISPLILSALALYSVFFKVHYYQ